MKIKSKFFNLLLFYAIYDPSCERQETFKNYIGTNASFANA